jgi:hypothetical protein
MKAPPNELHSHSTAKVATVLGVYLIFSQQHVQKKNEGRKDMYEQ